MAANAAASAAGASQEKYEKQLQGKSTASLFSDSTVRSDLAHNFKGINSSDGKELEGDIICSGVESVAEVLPKFRGMIKERFEADKQKGLLDARKWLFKAVPLYLCPGKSLDDFYTGYLLWAQKDPDVAASRFNLSKAFRRIEACANFAWKHRARLGVETSRADIERAYSQWGQIVSEHPDVDGRTVWYIDFTMIDTKAMKAENNWDLQLRLFWFMMTWMAMDPQTQKNGVTLWEDMGYTSFMGFLTLIPRELNNDIKDMTTGVAGMKMKHFLISRMPWWGRLMLNMMWMFLSDKMRKRFTVIPGEDWPALYTRLGGADKVPACYGDGTAKGAVFDRILGKVLYEAVPGGGRRFLEVGIAKDRPAGESEEFEYESDDEFSL